MSRCRNVALDEMDELHQGESTVLNKVQGRSWKRRWRCTYIEGKRRRKEDNEVKIYQPVVEPNRLLDTNFGMLDNN